MGGAKPKDYLKKLREENQRLRVAIEDLTILNEIATALGSTSSLEQVMELIIRKCIKHLGAEQGSVMLIDPEDKDKAFRTMIRRANSAEEVLPYRMDAQLRGWMLKNQMPLLINDFSRDDRFRLDHRENHTIQSLLSVPLMRKGRMTGALNVFNKRSREGFTEADKRLLAIIAAQSAQTIENARLAEEEQTLLLIQEEMRLAYKIQMGLLPKGPPSISGYDIAGRSVPAKVVGGDYYDFIMMDEHRVGLCLGDVSGKGMPAALLMANLQATLRGQTLENLSPSKTVERANTMLLRSTDLDRFATLFYGILDGRRHLVSYCNAGHNYPFLVRADGSSVNLETCGTVVGCFEDACYADEGVSVEVEDVLVVYSDGIIEATNASGEEFGNRRLLEIVISNRHDTAAQLVETIIQLVRHHGGELRQMDDMTLVVVKRLR